MIMIQELTDNSSKDWQEFWKIRSVFSGLQRNMQTAKDVFFIGRGIDYAICLEGSLKMKEISYIHSEAYAAGELKHGTISLVEDGTLGDRCSDTADHLYEKTVSAIMVECEESWRISDGPDNIMATII